MSFYINTTHAKPRSWGLTYDLLCVLAGSLFIALCAQASFYLWFTPVPVSLQTLAVLLAGGCLGSKRGSLTVIAYLGQMAIGLPFGAGGAAGIAALLGPSSGYFLGFIVTAFVVGFLLERNKNTGYLFTFAAMLISSIITLAIGGFVLGFYVGFNKALALGIYPYIIGDFVKVLIATAMVPSAQKVRNLLRCRE